MERNMSFMKEIGMNFSIDKYIYKLYLTYLRIEIDPEFLIKEESKDKKKDLYMQKKCAVSGTLARRG